ncbi:MAG: methyltransferase domain-containing protein, partial [Candidatus Limnocylindrales bacterium]
ERFDCLWCGTSHAVRTPGDLEGWAQLCPACLGKAGMNTFLRVRLRTALAERGASAAVDPSDARGATPRAEPATSGTEPAAPYPRPSTPRPGAHTTPAFPDDWFLRRGVFVHGAIHDAAWQAELDVVTRWLDGLPLAGRIDEPAAGTGFFSPLLAEKGELHASDSDSGALDVARARLVAHRLLAHLHVSDPWALPADGPADALVASFLTGRVRGAGLDRAAETLHARLKPGGRLALVDLRPDPAGGPPDGISWTWHDPAVLEATLVRAGFTNLTLTPTGRFFLLATAEAA